jgi:hypothetical protein
LKPQATWSSSESAATSHDMKQNARRRLSAKPSRGIRTHPSIRTLRAMTMTRGKFGSSKTPATMSGNGRTLPEWTISKRRCDTVNRFPMPLAFSRPAAFSARRYANNRWLGSSQRLSSEHGSERDRHHCRHRRRAEERRPAPRSARAERRCPEDGSDPIGVLRRT